MAYLHRLRAALLLVAVLVFSGGAGAAQAWTSTSGAGGTYASPQALCDAWVANANAWYASWTEKFNFYCYYVSPIRTEGNVLVSDIEVRDFLHPGYTSSGRATSPLDPDGTSPADTAKAIADSLGKDGELCGLGTPTMSMCYQGYVMRGSWAGVASMNGGTNNGFCTFGPFTADGTTCTGTETGAPSGAPSTCTGGKVPGTVNGVAVCVDPGTTTAPGSSSSGSSSGTDGSGSSNSGSQTTCSGDTCTTTTTTTTTNASGGTGTSTTSTTQPKSTFCAENPSSPLCTAGSFSGSCGAAPACSGDAVQCAQARYVFETSCSLAKPGDDNEQLVAFKRAVAAGDGDQTKDLPGNKEVAIGPSSFDGSNPLGSSEGVADLELVVAGKAVSLPFSMVNEWLAHIGTVLQIVTFLLCIRIVARG